jgi:all-trans-retinol 13,14-reductase
MADLLIRQAEKTILPGLSRAIEVREIGAPLTNVRYTRNHRGAIYGWVNVRSESRQEMLLGLVAQG